MAAARLIAQTPNPGDAEIDAAMTNICRCATYPRIRAAVRPGPARAEAGRMIGTPKGARGNLVRPNDCARRARRGPAPLIPK